MKRKFDLDELDCANCGAKMEAAIKKIEGVKDASVNFVMQRLSIDADDERFEDIMEEVQKICFKIEPDCKIVRKA